MDLIKWELHIMICYLCKTVIVYEYYEKEYYELNSDWEITGIGRCPG